MKTRGIAAQILLMPLLVVLAPASIVSQEQHPTAQQIVERIQKSVGVAWHEPTVDTFKAGDPSTPVTGIAVTMMATLEVLQRAANSGDNLIITHEPTFYGHLDETAGLAKEGDPVFVAKEAFIRERHLVVWRFHDFWHERKPDGILTGMIGALDWGKFQNASNRNVFDLPSTTLGQLAADIQAKLIIRTLRVVGDASVMVTRIALSEGFSGFATNRRLFQFDGDLLVIGEDHEWGNHRVRCGRHNGGKAQGPHRARSCAFGTGGNGGMRAVAPDLCA